MLSVEEIIEDCRSLLQSADVEHVVAGYVSQLLRDRPDDVADLLGDGTDSALLHQASDLTIVKVVMPPRYAFYPHNHLVWAVVGTVAGREDNTFFAREDGGIVATSGAAYEAGQVGVLGNDVIHAVQNPSREHTVGLHVYGGDLLSAPASEWDPRTGDEHPYDADAAAARREAWVAALSR